MRTLGQETQAERAPAPEAVISGRIANRLRDFLLLLYVIVTVGTVLDLILLGHLENVRQGAPLLVLPAGLLALTWHRIRRTRRATRAFQFAMLLAVTTGFAGLWFHSSQNVGFAFEMDPSAGGWPILRESLLGPAPTLAPGTLVHIGLLGLLYTYRHPWLRAAADAQNLSPAACAAVQRPRKPHGESALRAEPVPGGLRGEAHPP